jgi:hypothetical protein
MLLQADDQFEWMLLAAGAAHGAAVVLCRVSDERMRHYWVSDWHGICMLITSLAYRHDVHSTMLCVAIAGGYSQSAVL